MNTALPLSKFTFRSRRPMLIAVIGLLIRFSASGQVTTVETYSTAGAHSFSVPSTIEVTKVRVELWGGGGAGGGVTNAGIATGGGGGGGSYLLATDVTIPDAPVNLVVGAGGTGVAGNAGNPGGASSFASPTPLTTPGGTGGGAGINPGTLNGAGGAGAIGTNNGGNGGTGNATSGNGNNSGGGGGGAGTGGDGQNANVITGGTGGTGTVSGGNGANGVNTSGNGTNATGLAAGGSGGRNGGAVAVRTGGNGGPGRVIVTYTVPNAPTTLALDGGDDTGISNSDRVTSQTTGLTITGNSNPNVVITLYDGASTTPLTTSPAVITATAGGAWTADISLAAGAHNITARATLNGNMGAASSILDIIVDTTPPTVTLNDSDAGDNFVKNSDANITFTVTYTDANGLAGTPTIDIGTVVTDGVMTSGGGGVWTYEWDIPAGDEIGQTVTVDGVTDVAGNPAGALSAVGNGTLTWIIDNTAPTVTLDDSDAGDNIVKNSDTNITFTATFSDTHGLTGSPVIDIGTTVNNGTMTNTGGDVWEYEWDIPGGDAVGQAVTFEGLTDIAGNPAAAPTAVGNGTLSWIIDNTGPTVTLNDSDAGDNIVKDSDPDITFTATFSDAHGLAGTPTIDIGTVVTNGTMTSGGGGVWTYEWDIPAGDEVGQAVTFDGVTDVAGNPASAPSAVGNGTLSWIIDNTAPTVTLNDSDAGDNFVKNSDANITFTVTYTDANGLAGTPTIDIGTVVTDGVMTSGGGGVWTYEWDIPAGDEIGQTVTVDGVTDAAGNPAGALSAVGNGTLTWIIDNTAPTVTLDDSDAGDNIVKNSDTNITFTATFSDAHALTGSPVIDIGTVVSNGTMTSGGGGVWTYVWDIPGGDAVGQAVTFEGLTDAAGNPAAAPTVVGNGTLTWIIDNTPPTVTLNDSDAGDNIVKNSDPNVTFTATFSDAHGLAGTPTIDIGTVVTNGTMTSGGGGVWTYEWDIPGGDEVNQAVTLDGVTDVAGNPAPATPSAVGNGTLSWIIDNTAPDISVTSNATPPNPGLKINDQIIFTITPDDPEMNLIISPTTGGYNTGNLVWSTVDGSAYTATYTVLAGHPDHFPEGPELSGVTATDVAGNTSTPVSTSNVVKSIDANAPATPTTATAAVNGGTVYSGWYNASNNGFTFTVSIASDATLVGGKVQVLMDNELNPGFTQLGPDQSITATGTNLIFTVNHSVLQSHPAYGQGRTLEFQIRITDASGNATTTSTLALQPEVDRILPANPDVTDLDATTDSYGGAPGSLGTNADNKTNSTNPLIHGTAESGTTVSLYSNGVTYLNASVASGGVFTIGAGNLPEGMHTLTALAVDPAGNVSAGSGSSISIEINRTAPTISSVIFSDNGGNPETIVISFSKTIDLADNQVPVIGSPGFSVSAGTIQGSGATRYSTLANTITLQSTTNHVWSQPVTNWTYTNSGTGPVAANHIKDIFGNELATSNNFTSVDNTSPTLITGLVFDPNGTGLEKIIFDVSEELDLAEGQVISGVSGFHDALHYHTATYTGKGTTNTITITSSADGHWTENSHTFYYNGATFVGDLSGNQLTLFSAEPMLLWRVRIASNNANPAYAKIGDEITIVINSNRNLLAPPTVVIEGITATVTTTGVNQYSATITTTGAITDGPIDFVVTALETGKTTVTTKTTDNSTVTFDNIAPVITPISIASNNANSSAQAKVGNLVTVTFTLSEPVPTPSVTIGGRAATVSNVGLVYKGELILNGSEPEGILAFNISLADFAGHTASANAITTGSEVDFDKTVPTVQSFTLTDANPNNTTAVNFDVVFSEPVTGVTADDFQTFGVASGGTESISVTPISGTDYTVTVSGISKSGLLGIQIVDDNSIEDDADNFLGGPGVQGPFQSGTYTIFFPQPTNHATAFAVAPAFTTTTALRLTWNDATGATLPTGYLITVERFGATAMVPVDGTEPADQTNLVAFASGQLKRPAGTGFADFTNLLSGESYTFKIYSYTNTGTAIDFKLNGTIPVTVGVTPTAPNTTVWYWDEHTASIPATDMTNVATAPVNFQIYVADDDWGNGDNASTKISKIRIKRGGAAVDWSDALTSVHIMRGAVTKNGTIAVTGDYIEFDNLYVQGSETFGEVADGALVVYDIKLVLNPLMSQSLKNTIDGTTFPFVVDAETDVTFASGSSGLYPLFNFDFSTSVSSNRVQVTADRLSFFTEPPLSPTVVYVEKQLVTPPVIRAVDIHTFTDRDYVSNLALSTASATPSTTSLTRDAAAPNGGVYTFPSTFRYLNDGTPGPGNGTITVSGTSVGTTSSGQVDVIYSNDVTITKADNESTTMQSTTVTANSYMAFSFNVVDDNIDGAPTLITGIKITQIATANGITNWNDALAGAALNDGSGTVFLNATSPIGSNEINFTGIGTAPGPISGSMASLGYVAPNTTKTYRLYIWLKSTGLGGTLPVDIDGMNFAFEVQDGNITHSIDGSTFDGSQEVNSNQYGSRNNVSVVADRLRYLAEPGADLLVNVDLGNQPPVPVVEAVDQYNNRDHEYESTTITVTNDKGLSMSGVPAGTDFNVGLLTFPSTFRFTTIGTNVRLTVASTGPSVVASTPPSSLFNVRVASSATIGPGAGTEPAQISSLVDTDAEKVMVFDFAIHDDPDASTIPQEDDGNPTLVTDVTILSQGGPNNTIADWDKVIAAAYLYDGSTTSAPGQIFADRIEFHGIAAANPSDLGYIADGTTVTPGSKTYQLLIYLRTDIEVNMPGPIDTQKFGFLVNSGSIITDVNGTSILPSESEDSGAANEIDVVATVLDFGPTPPSISISTNFTPPVFVEARDINGNRDINFTGTITAFGTITPPTVPPVQTANDPTGSFTAGTFTFPANFQYVTDGNSENGKGTLVMTAGGISGQSGSITITSSFDSNLAFDADGPSGPIPYIEYQANDILFDTQSVELARLTLTDGTATGDIDGANTILTSFTISITNPSNLKRVALYDALNNEIAGTEQAVTGSTVVFTPTSAIEAVDTQTALQGIKKFSIRATFKDNATDVHDHDAIDIQITSATLAAGSQFIVGAGLIGGVMNGSVSPSQSIEVLATQIDFIVPTASYEGINQPITEPQAHARDANAVLDLDVTGAAGNAVVSTPTASFTNEPSSFNLGVLDFPGFQYTSTGNGTLTINATNAIGNPITGTSTHVDVIHVETSLANGGVYLLNLGGGVKNKVIFGATFEAAHGTLTEPFLEEFTFTFDTNGSITGVFENFRVYESEDNFYQEGLDQDVALNFGAQLTAGAKSLRVVFPSPRNLSQNPVANGGALTYFLKVDVAESANPSTPEIRPQMLDDGFGQPTDGNIVTSVGSATSHGIEGISYNFAAVLAPTVVSSYPARGQLNIDPTQPELELVFSVPVWTLDGKARLYKKRTGAFVQELTALNGFYDASLSPDPHSAPTNKANLAGTVANPLRFALPVLDSNEEYYVTMEPGNETNQHGVMDEFGNLSLGFSFSEVLFFKTVNPNPPVLIKSPSTIVTSVTLAGAVVNGIFDQPGKAYFMVVPNGNPIPTTAHIRGTSTYPGTVTYRGNFVISQTATISQYGIIDAPLGIGTTYNVWMFAESYSSKNHIETPITTTAPYGNAANNHTVGMTGPTLNFNGPSGSPTTVQINPPTVKMCANSYQTLSSPIVIVEGLNNNFDTGGAVQTFNLLLPTGFQFDITTVNNTPGGAPLYGTINLIGADFVPLVPLGPVEGRLSFINNSILRVQFANSGSTSKDKITITGLKVFATATGSGDLTRLGGTAIPTVADESVFAKLIASDAPIIGFTNAYTEAEFPSRPIGQEVTIIPDNYNDPAFTVQLIPEPPAGDYGASSFSGPGVNINNLNLTAVTLGVPFNIVITHADNNGCISQAPVQYTVYDHRKAIGTLNTEYCIENGNFPNPASPGLSANIVTIPHNNNPATFMTTMSADLPNHAVPAGSSTQIMNGPDWRQIVTSSLLIQGTPQFPFGGDPTKSTHSYSFDFATILNAPQAFPAIPDPYSHFREETQSGRVYYKGGSLGKVEFTANYRSVANSQAEYPLKQEVEFWLPPIPIVEVSSNVADINQSTTTFCRKGGSIAINGWPAASTGQSTGSFKVFDNDTNNDLNSPVAQAGFVDLGNGTATINPDVFYNNYRTIRIEYTFKNNNSPCGRTGSLVIRITPNPTAAFTTSTPACVGIPVAFDGTASNFGSETGYTISQWSWNFNDGSNFTSPNTASGTTTEHTYILHASYQPTLKVKSTFGCESTELARTVGVGAIPEVNFSFRGISTADQIRFTNASTVPVSPTLADGTGRLDWTFGDGSTGVVTSGFTTPTPHQYADPDHYDVNLRVTSIVGCTNAVSKEIIVLDRRVITDTQFYEERFTTSDGNWQVASYDPLNAVGPSWTWGEPVTGTGRAITLTDVNEGKVWITNSAGQYNGFERSAIYSPSLDMSHPGLSRPMISLLTSRHLAEGDGVVIEYSTDNRNIADPQKAWTVLIDDFDGEESGDSWYNAQGLGSQPGSQTTGYGWSGSSPADIGWKESKHILDRLPTNRTNVVFRLALGSVSGAPRTPIKEGFAFDNVRIGNRTRTVLLENFSNLGTNTTTRVNGQDVITEKNESDSLKKFNPGGLGTKLVKVIYHVGFPRKDPFNEDNPQDPSARALYYGVKTPPQARLDGETPNENALFSTWGKRRYNLQTLKLSEAELIPVATVQNGTIRVNVGIRAIIQGKEIPEGTILHVAIVEKAIRRSDMSQAQQSMIHTDETWFEYVLKKMLPSAVGTKLTQRIAFGDPMLQLGPFEWEPDLGRLYLPQNDLAVVVFLQDESKRIVYQAEIIDVNDPGIVTGLEDGLRIEDIAVYPNPANQEMNILLPRKAIGQVKLRLIDQMGKPVVTDAIPDGERARNLAVQDLASGVYILQVEENGRTAFRKVMVVH